MSPRRAASSLAVAASACGKVILLGEHAVVHGQPALCAAIGRSVLVRLAPAPAGTRRVLDGDARAHLAVEKAADLLGVPREEGIEVRSSGDLPMSMGLGSSAAFSVALLRALARKVGTELSPDLLFRHAHELERIFHGTPSGADAATCALGGLLWFEAGPPRRYERVRLPSPLALVVILSGTERKTSMTVGRLGDRARAEPDVYQTIFAEIGSLVSAAREALENDDRPRLGDLMSRNHDLLRECAVSSQELDTAVARALQLGALGAKLTGAGGGGAALALPGGPAEDLVEKLAGEGFEAFPIEAGIDPTTRSPGWTGSDSA